MVDNAYVGVLPALVYIVSTVCVSVMFLLCETAAVTRSAQVCLYSWSALCLDRQRVIFCRCYYFEQTEWWYTNSL